MAQKNHFVFHSAKFIGNSTFQEVKCPSGLTTGVKYFQSYLERKNSDQQIRRLTNHLNHNPSEILKQSRFFPNRYDRPVVPKSNQQRQKQKMKTQVYNANKESFIEDKHRQQRTNLLTSMFRKIPKLREIGTEIRQSPKANSVHLFQPKRIDEFKKLKKLGCGNFGEVFLVKHKKTGFIAALKIIQKSNLLSGRAEENQKAMNQLISQIKIQSFLSHPNLIKLYSFFSDETNVYLLLELAEDGHLLELLERHNSLSEETTSIIARQVVEGVSYMHEHEVIHRDIKLQNIVLCQGMAKICDFGWSVYSPSEFRSTLCGTPLYLSPEILLGQYYNQKIDSWAIGALTHELFTGENAFKIKKKDDLSKIITEDFQMESGSAEMRNFVTSILQKNPAKRPDTKIIKRHAFIQRYKDLQTSDELCHLTSLKFIN